MEDGKGGDQVGMRGIALDEFNRAWDTLAGDGLVDERGSAEYRRVKSQVEAHGVMVHADPEDQAFFCTLKALAEASADVDDEDLDE